MGRLDGRVALITGAASGLGRVAAERFAAEGAPVVVADLADDAGARAVDAIRAAGGEAAFVHTDVSDDGQVAAMVRFVLETYGRLDVLYNNAGILPPDDGGTLDTPERTWEQVMAVNLKGVWLGCKHGIRAMRKAGKGSIINVSSRSGLVGMPGAAAYAASKAGVRNHTKTVALWCAQERLAIRCNSVHPAAILTPMWEPLLGNGPDREERMRAMVAETPSAGSALHRRWPRSAFTSRPTNPRTPPARSSTSTAGCSPGAHPRRSRRADPPVPRILVVRGRRRGSARVVTAAQGSFARPPPSRACRLHALAAIALRAALSPRISASCAACGRAR